MKTLLPQIVRIAEDAGRAILRVYQGTEFGVSAKADASPLTAADIAAQETILAGLQALTDFPVIPVISEESAAAAFDVRKDWPSFWLVDPLDGTREFIARNGEFTVNIALIREGRSVLGVVHAPVLGRTYWAAQGLGAFVRDGQGAPQRIRVRENAEVLTVAVSRSHGGEKLPAFLERLGSHEVRPMGSSLKFCLVAQGEAQLYPRLGPTYEWDTGAAHCVVTEAGGILSDFNGQELRYNKPDLHNPWCVAAATTHEHGAALGALLAIAPEAC